MRKLLPLPVMLCLFYLIGCDKEVIQQEIGGAIDDHGCLPAAGEIWCEHTNSCERSCEPAEKEDFVNIQE